MKVKNPYNGYYFIGVILYLVLLSSIYSQTQQEVLSELQKQEVLFPEIVLAQSILETGWYKCKNCSMDKNNLFGLWNHRQQTYYQFKTWQLSVTAYKNYIQYKWYKKDYEDYYQFLTEIGYATDINYISKIKQIVNKITP